MAAGGRKGIIDSMVRAAKLFRSFAKTAKSGNRPNSYRRGYWTKKEKRIRQIVFIRDRWICQDCGRFCVEKAGAPGLWPHCDHIVPKSQGGSDEPHNRQTLCGSCHSVKTRREEGAK